MALKKYTFWQKIQSTISGTVLGAIFGFTLGAFLTAAGVFFPPLGVLGLILLTTAIVALVGGVTGARKRPKGAFYDDGCDLESEFYKDTFYLDNFNEDERKALEQMQLSSAYLRWEWTQMWAAFDAACESLKPNFEQEIPVLKKALLLKLLSINATYRLAYSLWEITSQLKEVLTIKDRDDRFEETARICGLIVIKLSNDRRNSHARPNEAEVRGTADIAQSFSRAETKSEQAAERETQGPRFSGTERREWQPSNEEWRRWQEELQSRFAAFIRFFADLFLRQDQASQGRARSAMPPRFTEVERFVIVDHHDPYKILGVPQNASTEELNTAYRKAMLRCHPDRNQTNVEEATAKTKLVVQAQEMLKNSRPEVNRVLQEAALNSAQYSSSQSTGTCYEAPSRAEAMSSANSGRRAFRHRAMNMNGE